MKKIYLAACLSLFIFEANSQTSFWYEGFNSGPCSKGQSANATIATPTNGAWAITSFTLPFMNGPYANEWYISAEEQGQPINVCGGVTCGGFNNKTLHMSSNVPLPPPPIIDIGTDYESGPGNNTNKRAETPIVNCTGIKNVQLSFDLIYGGVPNFDYCDLEYSANGGATWSVLTTMAVPNNSFCPTIGTWTFYAIGLPPSLSNNPNVKIGFHWYNSDPVGGDLSIGMDNVQFSELTIATSATVGCLTATSTASIANAAIGNTSYTWSSIPNTVTFTPITGSTTSMQFPVNGTYTLLAYGSNVVGGVATSTAESVVNVGFGTTPMVNCTSNNSVICTGSSATLTGLNATTYTWNPGGPGATTVVSPSVNTTYTVTGKIGYCVSTKTIMQMVDPCTGLFDLTQLEKNTVVFPNPFGNELHFVSDGEMEICIRNFVGDVVKRTTIFKNSSINTSELSSGIYSVSVKTQSETKVFKVIKH